MEQGDAGELGVLPVVVVQTGQHRLNGQVGEAVSGCGKDVGDAGVHPGAVARVPAELPTHGVGSHDVGQIIPEHKHLRENGRFTSRPPLRHMLASGGGGGDWDLPVCRPP